MTIRPLPIHGRTRYRVECGKIDGKRHQPIFETRGEAEVFLKRAKEIKKYLGEKALSTWLNVKAPERGDFLKAQQLKQEKGVSTSWEEIIKFYLIHAQPSGSSQEVSKAVEEYLNDMKFRNLKPRTIKETGYRLKAFGEDFEGKHLHQINQMHVKEWLIKQPNPCTRNTYRKSLHELFAFGVAQGWCSGNPCTHVKKAKEDETEPEVYSNEEVQKLLDTAATTPELRCLLAWYSIAFFAFLRSGELETLDWSDVHLDSRMPFIRIDPDNKTRSLRNVEILPNLKEILTPLANSSGAVHPINFERLRRKLHKKAGVLLKHNALRHTGASNHLEAFHSEDTTRKMLGQRTPDVLFKHYRSLVTPEAAEAYWKITVSVPRAKNDEEVSKKP